MVSPITNRLIPAEILTSSHYIFGQIKVIQSGLVGMLTDMTTSYIEINDASIAPIHKPASVVNYASQLYMVRSEIAAVSLRKRDYMGLQGVMKSGYQRLIPYPVQISTRTFDIAGMIEWSGRFEFSALITEGTSYFIIVYDATLTAPRYPEIKIESPVMLLNRSFLETLIVNKKSPTIPVADESL
jgi:GTPase SAR1 family protein